MWRETWPSVKFLPQRRRHLTHKAHQLLRHLTHKVPHRRRFISSGIPSKPSMLNLKSYYISAGFGKCQISSHRARRSKGVVMGIRVLQYSHLAMGPRSQNSPALNPYPKHFCSQFQPLQLPPHTNRQDSCTLMVLFVLGLVKMVFECNTH
jgi:hypothetical protein